MVVNNGQMRFAMFGAPAGEGEATHWPESHAAGITGQLGRWTHLAAVFDADRRQVSFYTNGQFDSTVTLTTGLPAVLGPGQIGNWNLKNTFNAPFNTPSRRLSGRMDEFAALGRALSAAEIQAYFAASNPYK